MDENSQRIIAVFGGYRPKPGDPVYHQAEEVGRRIAESGWALLNGGYGGTMEASARGAREQGGRVIGATAGIFSKSPNEFITEVAHTGDLWERIRLMLDRSDAFIALPGSTGTLAEAAMAWEMVYKGFILPKPLILLGEFWRPMYDMFVAPLDGAAACNGLIHIEPTPESAISWLRGHFG
jgi:hypothetical protein